MSLLDPDSFNFTRETCYAGESRSFSKHKSSNTDRIDLLDLVHKKNAFNIFHSEFSIKLGCLKERVKKREI